MTDDTGTADPTPKTPEWGEPGADQIDMMLAGLTLSAQTTPELKLGVTLTVRGATITGTLVGRNTWLQKLHQVRGEALGHEVTQVWIDLLSYDPETEPARLDSDRFIHLIDARTITPSGAIPAFDGTGMFWRGLLASVDGWSIGSIGPNVDDD